MLITDLQKIREAGVHQQRAGGTLALEEGVGGHGGAKAHLIHQARRDLCGASFEIEPVANHPHRGIARALGLLGEHFAHQQLSLGRARHQIGEGATAIDPKPPAGWRHAEAIDLNAILWIAWSESDGGSRDTGGLRWPALASHR